MLQHDREIIPDEKRVNCVLWQKEGRRNFTMRLAHAQTLSRLPYLRNTVYQLDLEGEIEQPETVYVLCSHARSEIVTEKVQHLEFREFYPNQENLVSIPIQYTGVEEDIKRPKRYENATLRYKQHLSHVDLYWYGSGDIPSYISIDVSRLTPPDNATVSLADIKLHNLLRPVSSADLDSQKLLELTLDLPEDER